MAYSITTYNGRMKLMFPCTSVAQVIDELASMYGERFNVVLMVHDLLSGLEHVARIDDIWVIVAPASH